MTGSTWLRALVMLNLPGDQELNGMPDQWEFDHNLNTLLNDSAEVPDGDGISNINEYLDGTYPDSFDPSDDINGNGMLDVGDVFLLQQHLLGLIQLQDTALAHADVYPQAGDGLVTVSDRLLLEKRVLAVDSVQVGPDLYGVDRQQRPLSVAQ